MCVVKFLFGLLQWDIQWKKKVLLSPTVFQEPSSITYVKVNSSAELVCSTSFPSPIGVKLLRGFHDSRDLMYLNIENGEVTSRTTSTKFKGRIHVTRDERIKDRYGFRWRLSLLGVEDTNWYYCQWIAYESVMDGMRNGATIIVTGEESHNQLFESKHALSV